MLESIPEIIRLIFAFACLVSGDLRLLPALSSAENVDSLMRKRKKFLKIFENLSEHVQVGKNRWSESKDLVTEAKSLFGQSQIEHATKLKLEDSIGD